MLNLVDLSNNILSEQKSSKEKFFYTYDQDTKQAAIDFDKNTVQTSFEFQSSPNIIFVKNISTLEPADFYDDLPEIKLTDEEEVIRLKMVDEQKKKNPNFYDGKQIIISGVVYDDEENIVYLEAKKVPYSLIVTLSNKKFPPNSDIYQYNFFKTGVLAPIITRNSMSILMQRAALGLYSVPGGFLETHGEEKRLNFYDGNNLVIETATTELKEEIAGIKDSDKLRFDFSKPQITGISFRKTSTNPIGTVEFIAPVHANCHSSYLQYVFTHNLAKDAKEHTNKSEIIPLKSRERGVLTEKLLTNSKKMAGTSLYLPVALSLTRLENRETSLLDLPRSVPNSLSTAWPLTIFKARPDLPIPEESDTENVSSYSPD